MRAESERGDMIEIARDEREVCESGEREGCVMRYLIERGTD